jgi:hypothetical protein
MEFETTTIGNSSLYANLIFRNAIVFKFCYFLNIFLIYIIILKLLPNCVI